MASFIVVFPDPFAPKIKENRLLNSHDSVVCAAARYPSTVILFRYIEAPKLEMIFREDLTCDLIFQCEPVIASMRPFIVYFRTTVKTPAPLDAAAFDGSS